MYTSVNYLSFFAVEQNLLRVEVLKTPYVCSEKIHIVVQKISSDKRKAM